MRPEQQRDDDLRELVGRLVTRDERAWCEFVDRFAPRMNKYFCRVFRCEHDVAEDLTQECLKRILLFIAGFEYRTPNEFKTWVFVVALRVGVDHTRRLHPECPLPDYLQELAPDGPELQSEADVVSAIRDALDQLPSASREPLKLHYLQGITEQDIAGRLNISYGAVRVRLHRGLKKLKSILLSDRRILRRLRRR